MSNMTQKLNDLVSFVEFTHLFRAVERRIFIQGKEEFENDAEHSYQLALVAWYIITQEKLPLKLEKVFAYALAHDLVEAYAGDMRFDAPTDVKKAAEHEALKRIKLTFPRFKMLHDTIRRYEAKLDPESQFVFALDKLLPDINTFLDNGRLWQVGGVSFKERLGVISEKLAHSAIIERYHKEFQEMVNRYQNTLFPLDREDNE